MGSKKFLKLVNDERFTTKVGASKGCCFPDYCNDIACDPYQGMTDVCSAPYADYCSTAENCPTPDHCDSMTNPPDYCSKDNG